MTKRFLSLLLMFIVIFSYGVAQENATNDTTNKATETQNRGTIDETKIRLQNQEQADVTTSVKGVSFFSSLWKFILMLIIVCVLAYIVLKFLKKSQALSFNDDPYLKLAASLKLAPNKSLYIITLKREAFLIAVTEKDVSLISKIEDQELVDALNLAAENQEFEQKSFAEMLSALFKNPKTKQKNAQPQQAEVSDELTGEFLSGMREWLNQSENNISNTSKGNKG